MELQYGVDNLQWNVENISEQCPPEYQRAFREQQKSVWFPFQSCLKPLKSWSETGGLCSIPPQYIMFMVFVSFLSLVCSVFRKALLQKNVSFKLLLFPQTRACWCRRHMYVSLRRLQVIVCPQMLLSIVCDPGGWNWLLGLLVVGRWTCTAAAVWHVSLRHATVSLHVGISFAFVVMFYWDRLKEHPYTSVICLIPFLSLSQDWRAAVFKYSSRGR